VIFWSYDENGRFYRVPDTGMTLARKIVIRNIALLAGLALLGCVSLAGLLRLRESNDTLSKEFAELRLIEEVSRHTAAAREMISPGATADRAGLRAELVAAIDGLERFRAAQAENDEGSESHESAEDQTVADAGAHLARVLALPAPTGSDARTARAALDAVLADLNRFVRDADRLVARTERRAARGIYETLIVTAVIFLIITVAGCWISVSQYRGIIRPLRRLRDSTRTMAAGRFDQPVAADGELEFADLARDFNSMARQLDGLYRNLEEKVAQRSRELVRSERLASVGFLAAGVAHEINNPLGIMSGYAQLTLKRLESRNGNGGSGGGGTDASAVADAQRTLEIVRDESFRCRGITEKLLSLSQPGSGRREPVSLERVAREVADIVAAHRKYRRRALVLDLPADADRLLVWADEGEMKQVLLNLVINAMEAVEDGTGRVRIEASRADGTIQMRVHDNGCGMTPEVLERVFEPFFTTRRSGGDDGDRDHEPLEGTPGATTTTTLRHAGLGLSIAHAIVESHGGRLRAASDGPGAGSCFSVELPSYAKRDPSKEAPG
jgi:signal transduction histidine kinase